MALYESSYETKLFDQILSDNKPLAIIAIGIPGCGKTTMLKPMAEKQNLTYVNRDDIREELTGDPTNHSREKLVSRIMLERIQSSLSQAHGVIIDGTHSRAKDRRLMTNFCHHNGAKRIVGMWFDIPIEVCRKRNIARTRAVREAALFTMQHRLTVNPPSIDEGFDTIERITE